MKIDALDHTVLTVADVDASCAFCRNLKARCHVPAYAGPSCRCTSAIRTAT
jgi:hypothetical protein